jgi:hypothetical protein
MIEGEEQNEFTDGLTGDLVLSPIGEASKKDETPEEGGKPTEGGKPAEGEGKPEEGGKPAEEGGKPSEEGGKPSEEGGKPIDTQKGKDVTTLLSETFGGKYKTVDELKAANIPGQLEELGKLRDANKTLQEQIDKPALGFANEGIGKFNQFVKDTGINDYGAFNKLDKSDLENMDPMDALVLKQIIDNPSFAGQEVKIKKMLVKKYNVNPKDVEDEKLTEEDMELNKLSLNADAAKAQKELSELKGKIKMPEKIEIPATTNKPTDEELKQSRTAWDTVVGNMLGAFTEFSLNPNGTEEPLMKFSVTPESKQELTEFVVNYCVRNQLEPKKENIPEISDVIIGKYLRGNFNSILKVYGEKIEGDIKKKVEEEYENPSELGGGGKPPVNVLDEDGVEKAFKAEMGE